MQAETAQSGYPGSLTDEQKNLLAQFELRAIVAPENTPIIFVRHSSMRDGDEASTSTTSSSRSSSSSGSGSSHSPAVTDTAEAYTNTISKEHPPPLPHGILSDAPIHIGHARCTTVVKGTEPTVTTTERLAALEEAEGDGCLLGPSPPDLRAHLYWEVPQGRGAKCAECTGADPRGCCAPYTVSAVPLFHSHHGTLEGADGKAVSPHTIPMLGENEEHTKSLDERCQELADRLVQMSADVDAAEFDMDHHVPPPSEFF